MAAKGASPAGVELESLSAVFVTVAAFLIIGLFLVIPFLQVWIAENSGPFYHQTSLADLDGDGRLDVILAQARYESESGSFSGITLWMNQGGGKFVPSDQELPGGFSAAAGDVDRDGDADLLILDGADLWLVLNQGGFQGGRNGVFKTNNPIVPTFTGRGHIDMHGSVVLGDLNRDGQVDGFVSGCCYLDQQQPPDDNSLIPSFSWVWINDWDPQGWLNRHTLSLPGLDGLPLRAAALGDLDGDGDLDVFAVAGTPRLEKSSLLAGRILLNDGSGRLIDSGQRLGDTSSTSVALGDLDADGDLDALVGTEQGAVVWINQGGAQGGKPGTFALAGQPLAGGQAGAVFLADFNRDGTLDALVAGLEEAALWWNDGQGKFKLSDQRFRYSQRHGLAVGDFNGDGFPELFAAAYAESYTIWLNQPDGTFKAGSQP